MCNLSGILQFEFLNFEELTVDQVITVKFINGAFFWPTGQLVLNLLSVCPMYHDSSLLLFRLGTQCWTYGIFRPLGTSPVTRMIHTADAKQYSLNKPIYNLYHMTGTHDSAVPYMTCYI